MPNRARGARRGGVFFRRMTADFQTKNRHAVERSRGATRLPIDLLAYLVPVAVILVLLATYRVAPNFYLTYVLELTRREQQIVEIVTVASAFSASLLLLWSAWRLGSARGGPDRSGGAIIVGVIGVAAFFFAAEEISWGQTYLGWDTPDAVRPLGGETNLHNMKLPFFSIQGLGSVFLVAMFVGLPIAWRLRDRLPVPESWACAVAEGPVTFSMVVAFTWKAYKSAYRTVVPGVADAPTRFYVDFVEQINEQKELLVAVSLLMYGLYRVRLVRRLSQGRPRTETTDR